MSNTSSDAAYHDYHASLTLNLDTSSYAPAQHLLLGLLSPEFGIAALSGGDTLSFSIDVIGATAHSSASYDFSAADAAGAANFFDDKTLDVGDWSSWVSNSDKTLTLTFNLDLHSHTYGTGLNFDLIAGNSTLGSGPVASVPLPSGLWLFGSALLGALVRGRYARAGGKFS